MEGWIKPYFFAGTQAVFAWNDGKGNVGAALACNFTSLEGHLTDTNTTPARRVVLRSPGGMLTNGVWTHVALTFDQLSGSAPLWVNGSSVAQTNVGTFRPQTKAPVYLGRWLPWQNIFYGALDEFTIYNRALSPAEIQTVVAADAAGKCVPPQGCAPPPPDFVAWWRFESNALDHVASNPGIIQPTIEFRYGEVGRCLFFRTGHVRVPASSDLDVGRREGFTVEAWLVPGSSGAQPLIEWNRGTGTQGVSFATAPTNALQANLVDANGISHVITSPQKVLRGDWQHVALTYDKAVGIATLYHKGFPVAQTNLGSLTPRTSLPLYFGYRPYGNYPGSGARLYGVMDEISLYARALTAAEIKAIAKARNYGKCQAPPAVLTPPANLRVTVGTDAQFAVVATGNPRLRYQWFKDGARLTGATDATLALTGVQDAHAGNYRARVTNWFGGVLSSNALLQVNHPPVADASATVMRVLAPLHGFATVVLDGSRSSDPDGDSLSYAWWLGSDALATGMVAVVKRPAGSPSIALVVEDGLARSTNVLTLDILSPAQAIERLMRVVSAEVPRGQPLLATLHAALAAVNRDDPTPAVHQLQALQNKVRAQLAPEDAALADTLIRLAQEVIDALKGGTSGGGGPVKIHEATWQADGKFRVKLSGGPRRVYIVEASTDLVHWEAVGVAREVGQNLFDFEDVQTVQFPGRFYRVVSW